MKILKKGTPPPPWEKKSTCAKKDGGCGTVVMLEEADLCVTQYTAGWRCPVCNHETAIDVPPAMREKLRLALEAKKKAGGGVDMREVKMHNPTQGDDREIDHLEGNRG